MSQTERQIGQEEKSSLWKSRLFKVGVFVAAVGALIGASELITVGVVAAGGAWAMKGGK